MKDNLYQRVYTLVKKIPKGKVATYGQIATLAGSPRGARMVGWALHVLPEPETKKIPWQRVINRKGIISTTCSDHPKDLQKMILESEGVKVAEKEKIFWIDLEKYQWKT